MGNNLSNDDTCNLTAPGDQPNTDPLLGDLADNGGPTLTRALLPGSPAIDAGDVNCTDAEGAPLLTDQRGMPRPADGNDDGIAACDIGAFEVQPTPVGGSVTGVTPRTISCENITIGKRVNVPLPDDSQWDCEAAGLKVRPGDAIRQQVVGIADGTANVGGTVTGVDANKVVCDNRSTDRRVSIQLEKGDTTWDCEAAGLRVRAGDKVKQSVQGEAK